jgi:hypothetical protein
MIPNYTYITSIEFINKLKFDYVETFSFQRGAEFELQQEKFEKEYDKLNIQKTKYNNLNNEEEKRLLVLDELCGHTQYLIDQHNQFHYSSKMISTFSSTDLKMDLLKSILNTEINDIPAWMCAPIYREGIVFYDNKNNIVSVLNICLSCQDMETSKFNHINGDYKTYELLKQFFIKMGHQVET